jgi:hypothetical protein
MGARKQVGIGLSNRPARLHRQAESMPSRFQLFTSAGALHVLYKF